MNNSFRSKLLFLTLSLVFLISMQNIHQVLAYDPTIGWTSQATGCKPVSGNIDGTIDNVYLGVGSTVPQSILNQYPKATSGFLELWKTNMVGMTTNKLKSFIIPASQGYTQPGSQLYGKDLFFEVTILLIYNGDGSGITTRNSVVKVLYSLYTDCQVAVSSPQSPGAVQTTSSTSAVAPTTTASPPNYTGIIVAGGLIGLVILSAAGYMVMNGRKPNLSTDKIIDQTRHKETQNIQSLKESLVTKQDTVSKSGTKKQSMSRRRR